MSSFVLDPIHYKSVEVALNFHNTNSHCVIGDVFDEYGSSIGNSGRVMEILHQLNVEAVSLQYNEDEDNKLRVKLELEELNYKNERRYESLTLSGLLKALTSISYQIELHRVIKRRELTTLEGNSIKILNDLIIGLKGIVSEKSQDYQDAKCSIE